MRPTPFVLALLLLWAGPGQAAGLPPIDASLILPPPPAAGSPRAKAEVDELRHDQAISTKKALAAAASDATHEDGSVYSQVLGPEFDLAKLPATKAMLAGVHQAEEDTTEIPKTFFHRPRPWIVDPSIKTCVPHKPGPAANSYPSGHATGGYAQAEVLAALDPDKAQALLARASVFAENRLVCGFHFRSDIVAGQALGSVMAQRLMTDPAFQTKMAAARNELLTAHIIP